MDGIVGKDDAAILGTVENAGVQQGMHVAMHRLHVAADAARDVADGKSALAGHRLQDVPAPARQRLPEQVGRGERDEGALGRAAERRQRTLRHVLARGNAERDRVHSARSSSSAFTLGFMAAACRCCQQVQQNGSVSARISGFDPSRKSAPRTRIDEAVAQPCASPARRAAARPMQTRVNGVEMIAAVLAMGVS